MKMMIVVALALVAVACAAPVNEITEKERVIVEPIKILRSEFNQQPEGGYNYSFETENGISRNENGELKEALDEEKKPHNVIVVRGSYSYPDKEGKLDTITYSADENGYHAEGNSVPKVAPSRR